MEIGIALRIFLPVTPLWFAGNKSVIFAHDPVAFLLLSAPAHHSCQGYSRLLPTPKLYFKPKQNTTDAMSITLRTAAWQTVEKPFVKPVCTYFPFAEQQGKIPGKASSEK